MKNELVSAVEDILPLSRFRLSGGGELLDLEQYRQGYGQAMSQAYPNRHSVLPSRFIQATVDAEAVPDTHTTRLVELLDSALEPYIDPDSSSFHLRLPTQGAAGEVITNISVPCFSDQVVRCAALHGTRETVDMVLGWVKGEPAEYWHMVALGGVRLKMGNLEVLPGVELVHLDQGNLLRDVPEELVVRSFSRPRIGEVPSLADGVLRIRVDGDPVVVRPDAETRTERYTHTRSSSRFPDSLRRGLSMPSRSSGMSP